MTFIRRTRCPHCKAKLDAGQRIHVECIDPWAEAQQAKKEREEAKRVRAAAKVERATDRARKQAMKPLREFVKAAQTAFNQWVRARDWDKPCISCGTTNPPMKPGGAWDAGHWKSRGSHPELRFDEDNCHKQCKSCNAGSGKYGHKARTVSQDYECNLIDRIGHDRVERLKGPHPLPELTREYAIAIKAKYVQKLKDLKKETA